MNFAVNLIHLQINVEIDKLLVMFSFVALDKDYTTIYNKLFYVK